MSTKKTILLYYVSILVTAMIIGGFYPYATGSSIILNILFLPVVIFLWLIVYKINHKHIASVDQPKALFTSRKMLSVLIYSTILSTIIFVGAFLNIRSFKEAVVDILFLPVLVQLLSWFLPLLSKPKKAN